MPQICDMGPTALLPFRRKACLRIFPLLKIRRLRPGLNPRTWVPEASTLAPRPPKPLTSNVTLRHIRFTTVAVEKQLSIIYSDCTSVASFTQHATGTCGIILPSVACLAVHYVSTLSHKRHNCWRKLFDIKCMFWFSLQHLSETFLILRIRQDIIMKVNRSSCKVPVILVRI
jgi:hypothetical protein